MPSAADTLFARLQADCTAAEAAERAVRANVEAQLKEAEQARAFAWRRLSALGDMARIAALEPDRDLAVERQLVALFRDIGWIDSGLDELGEGARPLLDWLRFEAWYEADRGQPFLQVFERYMPPTPVVEF